MLDAVNESEKLKPFELGSPGPMRDQLVSAVLAGKKVATSALLAQYEDEQEPLPVAGELCAMIGSRGEFIATVEIVDVSIMKLGDADDRLAHEEGEGFESAADWRLAHEAFWRRDVLPELRQPLVLDADTEVVVERFRVADRPGR